MQRCIWCDEDPTYATCHDAKMGRGGIVRNRAKVEGTIKGARLWLDIMEKQKGGFSDLLWKHLDGKPRVNRWRETGQVPTTSPQAEAMSKELKQLGFTFVGPTIVYAFMQAVGMVNDHLTVCHRHATLAAR